MRAVLQRVLSAAVTVDTQVVGQIHSGLLILLGVAESDTQEEAQLLAEKTVTLRIFADEEGRFNRSLQDTNGAALVVSQFTLYADVRKGRRPSFIHAATPDHAEPLVAAYIAALRQRDIPVETGVFGAMMHVSLVNDGPVTILLDTDIWKQSRAKSQS
jgi:D-tyrosyl-tRNA(Tyr) deacylase